MSTKDTNGTNGTNGADSQSENGFSQRHLLELEPEIRDVLMRRWLPPEVWQKVLARRERLEREANTNGASASLANADAWFGV